MVLLLFLFYIIYDMYLCETKSLSKITLFHWLWVIRLLETTVFQVDMHFDKQEENFWTQTK